MNNIYTSFMRFLLSCFLVFSYLESNATTFTVSNNTSMDPSLAGTLPYALQNCNVAGNKYVINFTTPAGTVYKHLGLGSANAPAAKDPIWVLKGTNTTALNTITINGNGNILDWTGYLGYAWETNVLVVTGSNITINDLTFTNAAGAGVCITDADDSNGLPAFTNINFTNCKFLNNKGAGIFNSTYAGGALPWSPLSTGTSKGINNVSLTGCVATGNAEAGIQFSKAKNIKILNTNASNNGVHGIWFTGFNYVNSVGYINESMANVMTVFKGVTNSIVDGCTLSGNGTSGAGCGLKLLGNCDSNEVTNNTANANKDHGIVLSVSSSDNKISNNIASFNTGSTFNCGIVIAMGGNANNIIKSNTVEGNNNVGIYLYDNYGIPNSNNLIESNTVIKNNTHGICVLNSRATVVRSNLVGTDISLTDKSNGGEGILFANNSSNGEISGNVVLFNKGNGISITAGTLIVKSSNENEINIDKSGSNNNYVFDNYVGINKMGIAMGNVMNGLQISESFGTVVGRSPLVFSAIVSSSATVYTTNTLYKNFIAGNTINGILLNKIDPNDASINPPIIAGITLMEGNFIGTNLSGLASVANLGDGINAVNSSRITILNNTIAGNTGDGVQLSNAASSSPADMITVEGNIIGLKTDTSGILANAGHGVYVDHISNVSIGDHTTNAFSAKSNTIAGNGLNGIEISALAANINVYNNHVGTNANGKVAFPNTIGISIDGANNNKVIGNLVSGNTSHGINVSNASGLTNPNTISKNIIGTVALGTTALPNGGKGIMLDNCNNNIIGGATLTDGNLVSGNKGDGIALVNNAEGNTIYGNIIGFSATGIAMGNKGNGIYLSQSSFNTIGASGFANVIGNNTKDGIALVNASTSNSIAYNKVGLNAAMSTGAPNNNGITITASNSNALSNNTIAGNANDGLVLNASSFNVVTGNNVGTNAVSANVGNGAIGISLKTGAASNTISTGNVVANNQQAIVVDGLTTINNKISQNSVYCNFSVDQVPGIDLQNYGNVNFLNTLLPIQKPGLDILTKTLLMGGFTAALGSTVEVFLKDAGCTNCQQGKTYIGSTTIVAKSPILGDPLQGFVYNFAPNTALSSINCNDYVVTVTDINGNTSPFSTCSECVLSYQCTAEVIPSTTGLSTNTQGAYKWYNCTSKTIVADETASTFTPKVAGNYALIVEFNGCKDTSACYQLDVLTELEKSATALFSISPNPANDFVVVNMNENVTTLLQLLDIYGNVVMQQMLTGGNNTLALTPLPSGVYLCKMYTNTQAFTQKLMVVK
jgi:parallel beta-helix repeat protein